jgi:hypothetical protein
MLTACFKAEAGVLMSSISAINGGANEDQITLIAISDG